ncbi:MAG: hypothetical protein JO019_01170 [Candidatus Kaiserbacteria bacterium]|nr:hypothetical protein [Candidatus Kaiserbacteria bacterium]
MSSGNIVDLRRGRREPPRRQPAPPPRDPVRRVSLRSRRRRVRLLILLVVLIVLAALAYGVHYVSYLPRFALDIAQVDGAHQMNAQTVRDYAQSFIDSQPKSFISRSNMLMYPKAALEKSILDNFPPIKNVTISRRSLLGTEAAIHIDERAPFALWCGTICYVMDDSGFVFLDASSSIAAPSSPYTFSGGIDGESIGKTFAPGHLPGILALIKLLGNNGHVATGAKIDNDQDFFVYLREGYYLKASFGEDADQLSRNLLLILSSDALRSAQNIEYIDLRFGDRVYYKLQGEDQTAAPQE